MVYRPGTKPGMETYNKKCVSKQKTWRQNLKYQDLRFQIYLFLFKISDLKYQYLKFLLLP